MAKNKGTAPRLTLDITPDRWDRAVRSASGACLIADAIKDQYPELTSVRVDTATVRATDPQKGERYTWLTPEPAQLLLIGFDQGWNQTAEQVVLRNAVKVTRMYRSAPAQAARSERKAALEAKEATGETLTQRESQALSKMRATDELRPGPLPTSQGPVTDVQSRRLGPATVVGGKALLTGRKDPQLSAQLLARQDRHYGAKLAHPGIAWQEAVAKEAKRLVEEGLVEAASGATKPAPTASTEAQA